MEITHSWPIIITDLLESEELSMAQAEWAMREIITGSATEAQIGGFLTALAAKGVTVNEIVGFRDAVLDSAVPVGLSSNAVDIVGTGGDRFGTINVSTMASIIPAPSGAAPAPISATTAVGVAISTNDAVSPTPM